MYNHFYPRAISEASLPFCCCFMTAKCKHTRPFPGDFAICYTFLSACWQADVIFRNIGTAAFLSRFPTISGLEWAGQ